MSDLPTDLDDKLDILPDDLAGSLVDVPEGEASCTCGLTLPPAPNDEPTLHRCECGRIWATGDAFEVKATGGVAAHVPVKMWHDHRLLQVPESDDWQHAATTDPADWAKNIDKLVDAHTT